MRRLFALASLATALAACEPSLPPSLLPPALPALGPDAIAFVGVTVIPLDAERLLPDHTVLVSGGNIVAMGPSADVAPPAGTRVVDGRGKFLMPGLTDMHVHLTREENLYLYLARGVTTVRNMWGAPIHVRWREQIRAGRLDGPSIYTAGPIVDGLKPPHDGSLVMKGPDDAAGVIALHKRAQYDFIKVYSRLSAPAFEALAQAANAADITMGGHIPREVGFLRVLDAGVRSIEHLNSFDDALQADGSPLAGKYGDAQDKKIDYVDQAKIPALVKRIHDRGAFICPTRNLLNQITPAADIAKRLERPEMRYVPGYERAIWTSEGAPAADMRPRFDRTIALGDTLIRAVRDGGGRLLIGTDTGNPLVIPGYTLHEELSLFVKAGLTPYEVLRAATVGAAEFMRSSREVGTVAVGKRADLLLLDGNPLADIEQTGKIAGVMARGRYFGDAERAALLARVEAWAQGKTDPFAGVPPLSARGTPEFEATYLVSWRDVPFDHERLLVERTAQGERVIRAQTIDPHRGQWTTIHLAAGANGKGRWLSLESEGTEGHGKIEVTRERDKVHLRGTVLAGVETAADESLPEGATLGADKFLAGKILLSEALMRLDVGKSMEAREADVALGSYARVKGGPVTITRTPDATLIAGQNPAKRYEIATGRGKPNVLWLDEKGWPLGYDITSYGVSLRRMPR